MAVVSMKSLLETGVHFGHRTRKWNPRMKPYIFTERNGIHIIDLQQTMEALTEVFELVRDVVSQGGKVLFVCTKRQGQETIELEATRCGMPYVNARWLGGTLTNWQTIRSRIQELDELERQRDEGVFDLLTKREALTQERRIDKLQERLGGIREMTSVPDLLYVVDVRREETAIHEANLLEIPVIALVDTNCDPSTVDYVIPSNDDAIRAIKLMTSIIADAVLEGKAMRKDEEEGRPEEEMAAAAVEAELEKTDEELLGEATLAKLKTGEFGEEEEREAEAESEEDEQEAEEDEDEQEPAQEEDEDEEGDEAQEEDSDSDDEEDNDDDEDEES